jgi:hypothetical protein
MVKACDLVADVGLMVPSFGVTIYMYVDIVLEKSQGSWAFKNTSKKEK